MAFLLFLTLFSSLGLWQLRRADEKRALIAERESRALEPAIKLDGRQHDTEALRYRPVSVTGRYDSAHQFLLDNQVQDQRPGYQVLTPLRIADGGVALLVNRGWVPLGADRHDLPDLTLNQTDVSLTGNVDRFPSVGLRLEAAGIPAPGWPAVVQLVEPARIAERLGYPVLPYQVLLDPAAEEGFSRKWHAVPLNYEKNQGYALQWFLFAAVATVLYIRHGLKAAESRTST